MDTRFLTTFLELVNTRHFGKAAENLYLTQSAVSARIKQLEEYFQTTLFIRHRNSIQLTPAGEKLLPYAQELCETLALAKQAVNAEQVEHFVLGSSQLCSELIVTNMLSTFHQTFPNFLMRADVLSLEQLSRQLRERNIDIVLSTEPLKSEDVACRKVATLPLGVYLVGTKETRDFVHIEWGNKPKGEIQKALPTDYQLILATNSIGLAVSAIRHAGGLIAVPHHLASHILSGTDFHCVDALENCEVPIYLSCLKNIKRFGLIDVFDQLPSLIVDMIPQKQKLVDTTAH